MICSFLPTSIATAGSVEPDLSSGTDNGFFTYVDFTFEYSLVGKTALEFIPTDYSALPAGGTVKVQSDANAPFAKSVRIAKTGSTPYSVVKMFPANESFTTGTVMIKANIRGAGTLNLLKADGSVLAAQAITDTGALQEITLTHDLGTGESFNGISIVTDDALDVGRLTISTSDKPVLHSGSGMSGISGKMYGRLIPMMYHISLPSGFDPDSAEPYPIVIASARTNNGITSDELYYWAQGVEVERGDVPFIIVTIQSSFLGGIYGPEVGKSDGAFDSQAIMGLLAQISRDYNGENKFYFEGGYSASGRTFYPTLMLHPDKIEAASASSTNYMGGYYYTGDFASFTFDLSNPGFTERLGDLAGYTFADISYKPERINVPVRVTVGDSEVGWLNVYDGDPSTYVYGDTPPAYKSVYGLDTPEKLDELGVFFWNVTNPNIADHIVYPSRGSFFQQASRANLHMRKAGFRNLELLIDNKGHTPRLADSMSYFRNIYKQKKAGTYFPDVRDPSPSKPVAPALNYTAGSGAKLFIDNAAAYDTASYGALQYSVSGDSGATWGAWMDYDSAGIDILGMPGVISLRVRYAGNGDPVTGVGYKPSVPSAAAAVTIRVNAATPAAPQISYVPDSGTALVFDNIDTYDTATYGKLQYSFGRGNGPTWSTWADYPASGIDISSDKSNALVRVRYAGTVNTTDGTGLEPSDASASTQVTFTTEKSYLSMQKRINLADIVNNPAAYGATLNSGEWHAGQVWDGSAWTTTGVPATVATGTDKATLTFPFTGTGIEIESYAYKTDSFTHTYNVALDGNGVVEVPDSSGGYLAPKPLLESVLCIENPVWNEWWGHWPALTNNTAITYSTVTNTKNPKYDYTLSGVTHNMYDLPKGDYTISLSGNDYTTPYSAPLCYFTLNAFIIHSPFAPDAPIVSLNGTTLEISNLAALDAQYAAASSGGTAELLYQIKASGDSWGSAWTQYPSGGIDTSTLADGTYDIRVKFAEGTDWYESDMSASTQFTAAKGDSETWRDTGVTIHPSDGSFTETFTGVGFELWAAYPEGGNNLSAVKLYIDGVLYGDDGLWWGDYIEKVLGGDRPELVNGRCKIFSSIDKGIKLTYGLHTVEVVETFSYPSPYDYALTYFTEGPGEAIDPTVRITQGGLKVGPYDNGDMALFAARQNLESNVPYTLSAWVRGEGTLNLAAVNWNSTINWWVDTEGNAFDVYTDGFMLLSPYAWTHVSVQFTLTDPGNQAAYVGLVRPFNTDGEAYVYGLSLKKNGDDTELLDTDFSDNTVWHNFSSDSGLFTPVTADELKTLFPPYMPVTDIENVPDYVDVGSQTMGGTVDPSNATNKDIIWSVKDAGATGAEITNNVLTTTDVGVMVLTATIPGGLSKTMDFVKDYTITVLNNGSKSPVIVNVPYQMAPGDVGSVFGGFFGAQGESKIAILPLTGLTGECSPDNPDAFIINSFNVDETLAQFVIPDNVPNDVWAVWAGNDLGWSECKLVNKAEVYWVSEHTVYPGQKLTLGGRDFANPQNRSADGIQVQFIPVGGGEALTAKIYDLTDYTVQFYAPDGLVPGEKYDITYTNGAGGVYGVAKMNDITRERVTAVADNANLAYIDVKYDANVAWLSTVNTSFIANVKDAKYSGGAKGDGVANDTAAIVAAINDINANGGGILYLPEGVYSVDSAISLGNNTIMVGDGPDKTVLKWNGTNSGQYIVYANNVVNGIFDIKILSDIRRPIGSGYNYVMGGYTGGVAFYGGYSSNGGNILKNVDITLADGQGVSTYNTSSIVIEDSNINVSHAAVYCQPAGRVRFRNNTMRNELRATICFGDDLSVGLDYGQTYIEGNTLIGDSINRRALDNDPSIDANYKDWVEILYDMTEHRPTDFANGEEMVFVGNSIEGTYGDPASNAGEGVISQAISPNSWFGYVKSATTDRIATGKPSKIFNVIKNQYFVTIISGPGIGQMRTIVDTNGDELIVDKPWDIIPTSDSIYTVDSINMNRAIWADNKFSAAANKASFGLWAKSYDMTIANNYITGGAGIWFATSLYENPDPNGMNWCYHQYFLNIKNNYINSWGNPWFLAAHATGIGPSGDGGFGNAENPTYPASVAYGIRIVHNYLAAPNDLSDPENPVYGNNLWVDYKVNPDGTWSSTGGTMPKVPEIPQYLLDAAKAAGGAKPWWAYNYSTWTLDEREQIQHYGRWVPNNGIFISGDKSWLETPYPVANGEIVDGNIVTNTMNGVILGDTVWNTVVRNNTLTGNKNDGYRGIDTSIRTTQLSGGNGTPGYAPLAPINKSALTGEPESVDKAALVAAIGVAEANLGSVAVSIDGKDIVPSAEWVTAAAKDAYSAAIGDAQAVADSEEATQAEVDEALTALDSATGIFNAAKQNGITPDKAALLAAISDAEANLGSIAVSIDGKDIDPAKQWVTIAVRDAYMEAINSAKALEGNTDISQMVVDGALSTLNNVTETFNAAKQNGTKYDIIVTGNTPGNGQTSVDFKIASANGKGYKVYLSLTGDPDSFVPYANVSYNSKGVNIKGLANGETYYIYIKYIDPNGKITRSDVIELKPKK